MADFGVGETMLLVGSMAMAAASGAATMMQASDQADRAKAAFLQNAQTADQNAQRQAVAINNTEQQQADAATRAKADELRRADAQLGTLRVMAGEMGTGATTFNALVQQQDTAVGGDLSRIDTQYGNQHGAAEFAKTGVGLDYTSTMNNLNNQLTGTLANTSNTQIAAGMGIVGSGLSIGTSAMNHADTRALMTKMRSTNNY